MCEGQTPLKEYEKQSIESLVSFRSVRLLTSQAVAKELPWRGGARVIYFNQLNEGTVWLLMAYSKAKFDDLPPNILRELKNAIHQENN